MKRLPALVLFFSLAPSMARASFIEAETTYLSVGMLTGFAAHLGVPGHDLLGGEMTFNQMFPGALNERVVLGFGAFAQGEAVGFHHGRFALGGQIHAATAHYFDFGLEHGVSLELGDGKHAPSVGIQLAPFISLAGLLSVAFRMALPIASLTDAPRYPIEYGVILTLKFPIPLHGSYLH